MTQARPVNKGLLISLLPHVILLVAGIILTYFAHIKHQEALNNKINNALDNRLSSLSTGINSRLDLYQYGLFGLKGFVHGIGANNLNYQAIFNYSGSRNYAKEFPGANGIGFIKKVGVEQLNQFLSDAKNDRPDQTFNLNTLVATSDEHFIIQYIFPEQKNLQAIGLDIGSESMRKQAALNAAINNTAQLTAPLTLVQADKLSHQGFLILVPIYKTITISDNKKQRLNELLGWAYSPLLIDKILDSLAHLDENQLTISDINNNTETDFFSYGIKSETNHYQLTKIIKLMGRTWKITINASDAYIYNLHLPSRYQAIVNGSFATIGCMFIAFLMQLFIFRRSQRIKRKALQAKKNKLALQQANLKLESEVKQRTQEIADMSMLQRSIVNSTSYSIIATDLQGVITLFNPAAEKLLGYKADDIIGIQSPSIFHLKEEVVNKAALLTKELNHPLPLVLKY